MDNYHGNERNTITCRKSRQEEILGDFPNGTDLKSLIILDSRVEFVLCMNREKSKG